MVAPEFIAIAGFEPVGDGRFKPMARIFPKIVPEAEACRMLSVTPRELQARLKVRRVTPKESFYDLPELNAAIEKGAL